MNNETRYKQGHFIGLGIAIGLPLGIPIGLMLGNIALGPALGLPFGIAIGVLMEQRLNPHPIPLTEEEKARQRKWGWWGMVIGMVVFVLLLALYLVS